MRVVYYTEKTVAQGIAAVNERLHARGTRNTLDGWTEKNGTFALSVTTPVRGKFSRTSHLSGKLTRESGVTVCVVETPSGVNPRGRILVFVLLGIVAVLLTIAGSPLLAAAIVPLSALLYLPMKGDFENSAVLLAEVQRTLKAKTSPPKPTAKAPAKPAARPSTASKAPKSMFDE